LHKLLNKFENYLQNNTPTIKSFDNKFNDILNYSLSAKAKRFRPMLLLSVVKAYNKNQLKKSFNIALAIECLHTYSLIHDDLPCMDNASLRRGYKTLHKKYNEMSGVLAGDGLNTQAFYLISKSKFGNKIKNNLTKTLSLNGGINGMVIGQYIDCSYENITLPIKKLKFLHINKTAKLIASSLKMGAIISKASKVEQKALYNFGLQIGLLFQMQDDIIDETKTSKQAGKTTKADKAKNSFVNLLGIKEATKQTNKLADKCKKRLKNFDNFNKQLNKELSLLLDNYLYRHNN
jgi:farnesyl diphosphate synthase